MKFPFNVTYLSSFGVIHFNCCDSFPEHPLPSPVLISLSQRFIKGHSADEIL